MRHNVCSTAFAHRDGRAVLQECSLVCCHGYYGDAQVHPQHVDDAEPEESEAGDQVAPLNRALVPRQHPFLRLAQHALRNGRLKVGGLVHNSDLHECRYSV